MLLSKKACAVISLIIAMSISVAFSKNQSSHLFKLNLPFSMQSYK